MKIFIVLAHPEEQSFNGAMFRTAIDTLKASGHEVKTSDLYRQNFDPVSDRRNFTTVLDADYFKQQLEEIYATENDGFAPELDDEQKKVEWCDLMIWQFPLWWFSVPGVLKGWVDRTFAMGRFYGDGKMFDTGILKGKKAMLALTTGGVAENYQRHGSQGDIFSIIKHIHRGMLQFTGFTVLPPQIVYGPVRKSDEEKKAELEKWSERLKTIFAENELEVGEY